MTEITLRAATKSDAQTLSAIHEKSFPTYWNHEEFNNFFDVAGTHAFIAKVSATPSLTLPPLGGGESEAGMIVYRAQFEQADIITLAVLPACRRRGIANTLVKKALSHLSELGAKGIFLDVEDGNAAALRLYESFGFAVQRRRKLYYRQKDGTYTDALVMQKKIA